MKKGHYIKRNDTSRIPKRHIIIDTEARFHRKGKAEIQDWRCGVATFCVLTEAGTWKTSTQEYMSADDLWDDITSFTRARQRTVIWAHNLSYDIRVSRALECLAGLGWEMKDIRLAQQGTWAKFKRDDCALVAVDSAAVWGTSIEVLGSALGIGTVSYPATDDTAAWLAKCHRDVEILSTAVRKYISWLIDADMGSWQVTGAGQAWSAWRHKHYTHKILVADDLNAREAVRKAAWTGRAEAWSYGTDQTATVYDMDFQNAYPRIAEQIQVPVRQYSKAKVATLDGLIKLADRFCVLAELKVTTDHPIVPTEHDGHMIWPVGTFQTTLWDPEIRLLHEHSATVEVGQVWVYRKAPALRQWAQWILSELHKDNTEVPPWLKIILKHWSRALIGRFAMRFQSWEPFATSETSDIQLFIGHDFDEDRPFKLLQVGTKILALGEEMDGRDAVPEITGYIMSEARRRLWNAAQRIGQQHILYIDTDSMLCDVSGYRKACELANHPEMAGLRLKRRFRGYSIAGPRQVILGGEPRISGVPRKAKRTGEWEFEGEVWRGLDESIRHGQVSQVKISSRTFRVMKVDRRRIRNGDGRTVPIRLPIEKGQANADTAQPAL